MVDTYLGSPGELRLDDLAKIYNPLSEDFTWQISGIDYLVPAKGIKLLPRWSCGIIAKHLADKILQEQHKVADSNTDTPLRRKVLAELLPELEAPTVSEEEAEKSKETLVKNQENLAQTSKDPNYNAKRKVAPPTV